MPFFPAEAVNMADHGIHHVVHLGGELLVELVKRVNVPINASTPPEQIAEMSQDPWNRSGKYGLYWVYFGIILVLLTTVFRLYNYWGDKIRTALYKEEVINSAVEAPSYLDHYGFPTSRTHASTRTPFPFDAPPTSKSENSQRHFFPPDGPSMLANFNQQAAISSFKPVNNTIAFVRFIFYRPIPALRLWKFNFAFPSLGVVAIVTIGVAASFLYCFLPRPLFFTTLQYGSPPLAIRAGMLSVALLPWIVALASQVNPISYMTGIGAERLIVLHRWGAYVCIMFAIIHAVPFWWQSVRDPSGFAYFKQYFNQQYYIFTTGIAAFAPLLFLFFHSLPVLRHKAHEVFVILHIPVAWAFIILLFWHCHNYLTSWAYLYSTIVLMAIGLIGRVFYLNWSNPFRPSFMIGEESSVTILAENAIKVTVPTQRRWKPGQYAYIRMPGVAVLDNHPFTIASLCSEDFPSNYGEEYRDMTLVFRPFGGFTRKVLDTAVKKGRYKTYRAFVEGPYGGMQRQMSSFNQVIFFAGGSGITAIASQLLDLIKRMRDGKATTTTVHVIWAMKRPEIMAWFKEELRICRECAPPGSIQCNFYITSAKRYQTFPTGVTDTQINRLSGRFSGRIDEAMQGYASKRNSKIVEKFDQKEDLHNEITALPQMHLPPPKFTETPVPYFPPPPSSGEIQVDKHGVFQDRQVSTLSAVYAEAKYPTYGQLQPPQPVRHYKGRLSDEEAIQSFDFGFGLPEEPQHFRKSLMRFAFLPSATVQPHMTHIPLTPKKSPPLKTELTDMKQPDGTPAYSASVYATLPDSNRSRDGWQTEYGRPDIPHMLRTLSQDFGRRTCVFVCGPPEMRIDVARTVASLQRTIWQHPDRDELFLHTENYAI